MNKCVCGRVIGVINNTLSCTVCGWSKMIPSGTLILGSVEKKDVFEEKYYNEKKVLLHNNINPLTYHKCEKCTKITKQRMIVDDNNFVQLVCFECL